MTRVTFAKAALLLAAPLAAAPRFIGGGAVKMYVLELSLLLGLVACAWLLRK